MASKTLAVEVEVRLYVPGRRSYPGTEDDAVDQGHAPERHAFKQVGAQCDRAPDIVAGYQWCLELPGLYQLGEQAGLARDRDV
jgi:hypothetical protein